MFSQCLNDLGAAETKARLKGGKQVCLACISPVHGLRKLNSS